VDASPTKTADYHKADLYDEQLIPCPECEAEYNIPAVRRGPSVVMYTSSEYRVLCLSCWHKGPSKRTSKGAVESWNKTETPLHTRLRRKREALGWTGEEAAEKAGLCRRTVYRAESGRVQPTKETAKKLTEALGLEI
jgi:ribosome-binding protein aMBF1 (putative translation factor)